MARTKKTAKLRYKGKQSQNSKPTKSAGEQGAPLTVKDHKDKQQVRLASKATGQLAQQAKQAAQQTANARKRLEKKTKPYHNRPGTMALHEIWR